MIKTLIYLPFLFLPAYLLKIPLGTGASINALDLLLFLSFLAAMVELKKLYSFNELRKSFEQARFQLLLITAIIVSFSIAFSLNTTAKSWTDGAGILKSYFVLPLLFGIPVVLLLKKNWLSFPHLAWSLFASIGLQSVLGYFFAVQGKLTYDGRLVFIYDSPNYFAITTAIGTILGVYLLQNIARPGYNIFKSISAGKISIALLLIANIFSFVMTESLGAWLGLSVALGYYFFSGSHLSKARSISAVVLFLTLIFFAIFFSLNNIIHFSGYSPSVPPTSADSRIAIYLSGKKILSDNFLLGIGPGNFQTSYLKYQQFFPPYPQWAVLHAHNTILHYWLEGGLLAAIALALLLGNAFLLSKTKTATEQAVVLAVLLYFVAHGLFDVPLWKNDLAVIFWTFTSYSAIFKSNLSKFDLV